MSVSCECYALSLRWADALFRGVLSSVCVRVRVRVRAPAPECDQVQQ